MARIVLGAYMVRYPLGGALSAPLQWLVGFQRLGHEVYVVEKSGWPNSCYDPARDVQSDDCSYGTRAVRALLARFGLEDSWCFVDAGGRYHGMRRERVEAVCASADVFVDRGSHGLWLDEAADAGQRVLVEAEPGYTQMKMERDRATRQPTLRYDRHYSVGPNIGTPRSTAPTAGIRWCPVLSPVDVELFRPSPAPVAPLFTTVMNWRAHDPIEWNGDTYGQKDVEFEKFMDLPRRTATALELAVSGAQVPSQALTRCGWQLRDAHAVTATFDSYADYIARSSGEFGVAKNVFVSTRSGWFSDRSAAYLASGRPVVLQETGFSDHLPCGEGLFAVAGVDEAAAAIAEIVGNYELHARRAREIAVDCLDTRRVLAALLGEIGI